MALPTASDNVFPKVIISEGSAPSSPSSGQFKLYVDSSDHLLKYKNSSGTVTTLGAGFANPMTTAGDIIYGGASGVATRLAGGTSTYVLTSNGATSAPSWQAPGGGGGGALVLLEQHTASGSATLDFTTFISSTYDDYVFRFIGVVPATNGVDFYMRVSVAGTWDTGANYVNNHYLQATSGNVAVVGTNTQFAVRLNAEIVNTASKGLGGHMDLYDPQSTTLEKRIGGSIRWSGSGNWVHTIMDGSWTTSGSAVDGVRFFFSSGNIASGTIRVYGIAKS